jgi:hypothetical protein
MTHVQRRKMDKTKLLNSYKQKKNEEKKRKKKRQRV